MKRYLEHIKSQEPHYRRQHAMQVAGVVTALVFVVWITTLGMRLGSSNATLAEDGTQTSLGATAAASPYTGGNQLIVASSTQY